MRARPSGLALAAVVVAVVSAVWAWWLQRPPAPRSAEAPATAFSALRAVDDLLEIAAAPHMTGSAEHERVRRYIVARLVELGFETEIQEATVVDRRGRVIRAATVRNVLGRLRGSSPTGGVALAAHYDSQALAPGAGDDGAGVAAILEAARALQQEAPLRNDLFVVVTDAEEVGLFGARAFVEGHPWWPQIDVLVNIEARGAAGPSVMFETSAENGWVVRQLAEADPYPTGSSLFYEIYKRLPNDTDFSVFKRAGVVGLNFALAEGADVYHRPTDTIEKLSLASLQHHGEHALALSRRFGNADLSGPLEAPDVVFFPIGIRMLIVYGNHWVWPLTAWTALVALLVAAYARRHGHLTRGAVVAGVVLVVAAQAVAAAFAWLLFRASANSHHELGSIVGRAFYEEGWSMLAVVAASVAVVAAFYGAARRRFAPIGLALGAAMVPLLIAVATAAWVPGVNMLFAWPLLFALAALRYLASLPAERRADGARLGIVALLSLPAFLFLVPLIWGIYIGLSVAAAPVLAALTVLLSILLLPFFEIAAEDNRWWLPAAALALAVACLVAGLLDARPGDPRPVPVDLVYAMDRETGTAVWATTAGAGGVETTAADAAAAWLGRFFGPGAVQADLAPFLAGDRRRFRLAPAPVVDDVAATATVVSDLVDGDARRLRVEVRPEGPTELLAVSSAPGAAVSLRAVNGVAVEGGTRSPGWQLQHYGRPPGGVLVLDLLSEDPEAPVEIVLVEVAMHLPEPPGLDVGRPAGLVAHAGRLTDVSLFRQMLRFE